MKLLVFTATIAVVIGVIPEEYQEINKREMLVFSVSWPLNVAYACQMQPAYFIGAKFDRFNKTYYQVPLVLADPIDACSPLGNKIKTNTVVLIRRGTCTFVEKVMNAQDAGAVIALVMDSNADAPQGHEYILMMSDSSFRKASIPAAFISGYTGKILQRILRGGEEVTIGSIPTHDIDWPFAQIRKSPWERWEVDKTFIM